MFRESLSDDVDIVAGDLIPDKRRVRLSRILIVDDDEAILDSFRRAFRKHGYQVVVARSSEVALKRMSAAHDGAFCLAVLDIFLGGQTSGFQLARRMSELHPDAGILVVSGLLGDEPPEHDLNTDRMTFLKKPVALDLLLHVASRYCG